MEPIRVEFHRGVYLPEADFWFDPWDARERAFISHAHADHVAPHRRILCSEVTRRLIEKRFGRRGEIRGADFGAPLPVDEGGRFDAVLLPAGHVFGSAQIRVRRRRDGATLLYTGDFKLRAGAAAEPIEVQPADTVIMETTFGRAHFVMPPAEEVLQSLVRFAREAVEEGTVPMIGAYSLGKTQELLAALGSRAPELRFVLHRSAAGITRFYEEQGHSFPAWEVLVKDAQWDGRVLIAPPSALRSQQLRKVKPRATAMVTGWALDPNAKYRYQVDEVFPLSDHADYPALLEFVERTDPERVLTLHGYAEEFARDLRSRGREAWSLTGANQLDLFEGCEPAPPPEEPPAGTRPTSEKPAGEFGGFVRLTRDIGSTTGRLDKVTTLSAYFRGLDPDSLETAVRFLAGRTSARTDRDRALQVGWAIMKRALLEASGRTEAEYRRIVAGQNDAGRAARLLLEGQVSGGAVSLAEMRSFLGVLGEAKGPAAKVAILEERLAAMSPAEGACLIQVLTGDLRIGLKEGLIEEGLAEAFEQPVVDVRRAHMLTGDLGRTARLARADELGEAAVTPFVPLGCMLANPEETAQAIWDRLGHASAGRRGGILLEEKYDGIRAQLHRVGERVEIYSRDLRAVTAEFPELVEPARELGGDVILDGEIIASAEGKRLTFFDLQKRLGRRREGDLFLGEAVPVRFIAFDVLWKDEIDWLERPLRDRRRILESLNWAGPFELLEQTEARSVADIESAFKQSRLRGNEGLIAKDPESRYTPGRRGLAWLKLKQPLATLDCVVVKAEEGHGKRSHVLSDYTFAVRDEATDALVVLGKAYTGLTDEEIEELTAVFRGSTVTKSGRVHTVEPGIVLEITFDSIRPSRRHNSGLALRFPRIKGIRRDKTVAEIDTLGAARRLAGVEGGSEEARRTGR